MKRMGKREERLSAIIMAVLLSVNIFSTSYGLPYQQQAEGNWQTEEQETEPVIREDGTIPGYAEILKPEGRATYAISENGRSSGNVIGSEYIEYAVNGRGRFTIGNRKGREDTQNDDNKKLIYGHPTPSTSYTTVIIDGNPHIFFADEVSYDNESKTCTAVQKILGIKITQTLRIVSNAENGKEDTVYISYTAQNEENTFHSVGFRIMMDTMLGDNDGAPFKVPGIGNVTTELELKGNEIPKYWQAYDNLENASVFAIGTFYNNINERPDKVQFANWRKITGIAGEYSVTDGEPVTYDSAVAVYWNEKALYKDSQMTVGTSYGVGYSDSSSITSQQVNITNEQFGVLVLDLDGHAVQGATVKIGNRTKNSDDNGLAVFNISEDLGTVLIQVKKEHYNEVNTYTNVLCGTVTAVTLTASANNSIIGVTAEYRGERTELLSNYLNFSEYKEKEGRDPTDDVIKKLKITASMGSQIENVSYQIVQGTDIIAESNTPEFEFDVYEFVDDSTSSYREPCLKDFEMGKEVELLVFSNGEKITGRRLGLRIMSPGSYVKGISKFEMEYKNDLKFKVPEGVPIIGNSEIKLGTDKVDLPLLLAFDENKIKIGYNMPKDTFEKKFVNTANKKHEYYKALEEAKENNNYDKINEFLDKKRLHYGAGSVKGNLEVCGYGEATYVSDGRYEVALNISIFGKINGTYTYQTFIAVIPVYVKVDGTGKLGVDGKVEMMIHTKPQLTVENGDWDLTIKSPIELKPSVGVGFSGVLSCGVGGKLELLPEYRMKSHYAKVDLKGSAFLEAYLTPWIHYEKNWPVGTWNLYNGYLRAAAMAVETVDFYDLDDYSTVDMENVSDYSSWQSDNDTVVDDSVLRGNDIKLIEGADGSGHIFYTDTEDGDSLNNTGIVWARIASDSNAIDERERVLASPSNATGNTADLYYDVYSDQDIIYTVLAKAGREIESDDAGDILALSDIYVTEIDTKTSKIGTAKRITDDEMIDITPKVYHDESGTYVAWISVKADNNDIFDSNAEYFINLYGSKTGKIEQKSVGNHNIYGLAIGKLGNKISVIFSAGTDEDITTSEDAELFSYDGETKKQLTHNQVPDLSPQFTEVDSSNRVTWYSGGEICESENMNTSKVIVASSSNATPDYKAISSNGKSMIIWENIEQGKDTTAIYAVERRGSVWSDCFELYRGEDYVTSKIDGYIGKDGPSLLHINTDNIFLDENAGSALLLSRNIMNTNLTLESCIYDMDKIVLDEPLPLSLTVKNNGNTTVEEIIVSIDNEEIERVDASVKPGETKIIRTDEFILPELEGRTSFTAMVEAGTVNGEDLTDYGDSDYSDNSAVFELGWVDLMVDTGLEIINEEDYLNVTISNYSYMHSGAKLQLLADSMDGAVLYEKDIDDIAPGTSEIMKLKLSDITAGVKINCIYAIVTAEGDEKILENNSSGINVDDSVSRYSLSVQAGEGGSVSSVNGYYRQGATVVLQATAYEGYRFDRWETETEGILADLTAANTTLTMPEEDVIVRAIFEKQIEEGWNLRVEAGEGGHIEGAQSGVYQKGVQISLKAIAENGYHFTKWVIDPDGLIESAIAEEITFAMPEGTVTVSAQFEIDQVKPSEAEDDDSSDEYFSPYNMITDASYLLGGTWMTNVAGWKLLKKDNQYAKNQWVLVDDEWYLFDINSIMLTGWRLVNGKWYYLNISGAMLKGWLLNANKWYYLDPVSGDMKIGWILLDGKWYYLTPGSGAMKIGWARIEGKPYFFGTDGALIE